MIKNSGPTHMPSIGFVTVTRGPDEALYGGFLILNALGRPLEFHCTAPVRPSRAQQILYGPALDPYLFGERIGQTLIAAAGKPPSLVVTDREPVMAARSLVKCPLCLLADCLLAEADESCERSPAPPGEATEIFLRVDSAHRHGAPCWRHLERFHVDGYDLAVAVDRAGDRQVIESQWQQFAEQLDLHEPFERIRRAIEEARGGK